MMKFRAREDFWAGLMFVVFGAFFALGADQYTIGTPDEMGPGFLPLCVGVLLICAGAVLVGRSLLGADQDAFAEFRPAALLLISVAIFLFGLIFPRFGLIAAIVVLAVGSARASADFRLPEALLVGTVLAALSAGLFVYGLAVPLALWPNLQR